MKFRVAETSSFLCLVCLLSNGAPFDKNRRERNKNMILIGFFIEINFEKVIFIFF